jgi:hypothetical protein
VEGRALLDELAGTVERIVVLPQVGGGGGGAVGAAADDNDLEMGCATAQDGDLDARVKLPGAKAERR